MFALILSLNTLAKDVLVVPFHSEGLVDLEWLPSLEYATTYHLEQNRIDYISPDKIIKEYGKMSFCADRTCFEEMLFRPESDLILHGNFDCHIECSLVLSFYDGIKDTAAYQNKITGTFDNIFVEIPKIIGEMSKFAVENYKIEFSSKYTTRNMNMGFK